MKKLQVIAGKYRKFIRLGDVFLSHFVNLKTKIIPDVIINERTMRVIMFHSSAVSAVMLNLEKPSEVCHRTRKKIKATNARVVLF
ncbi:MAG: hypothetical protein M3Q58_04615 [Bacteroidota bacterium]|nr:hypothetical protein [Bacteroidota bacterium]